MEHVCKFYLVCELNSQTESKLNIFFMYNTFRYLNSFWLPFSKGKGKMKILYAIRIPKKYIKRDYHDEWYFNKAKTIENYRIYINSEVINNYYNDDIHNNIYIGMEITFDDKFTSHRSLKSAMRMGIESRDDIQEFKQHKNKIDEYFKSIMESDDFKIVLKRRFKNKKFKPQYYRLPVLPRDY